MKVGIFESPGREWDEFASQYSDLIFHQSIWAETLRKGLGAQPLYFYLRNDRGISAGFPSILLNLGPLKLLYSTISYGNLLGYKQLKPYLMDEIEREIVKRGIDQVRVIDSPFSPIGTPPTYEPFEALEGTCSVIDLRGMDKEKLLRSYAHYVRRDIGRAKRNGIIVEEAESENDFAFFYLLYLKSMARNNAAAKYSKKMVSALRELVVEKFGSLFLAKKDGVPVAGMLILYSSTTAHAILAGSDSRILKLQPNKILVHQILLHCVERGIATFDFGGSEVGDKELIRFKSLWGGKSVPVTTYVKSYSPLKCWAWDKVKPLAIRSAHALGLA